MQAEISHRMQLMFNHNSKLRYADSMQQMFLTIQ